MSDAIVKNLSFGDDARTQIFRGIEKLANAVSSTLGASGKCVILEDAQGKPVITKALEKVGWEPKISLKEGLKPTIEYFKNYIFN